MKLNFTPHKYKWVITNGGAIWSWRDLIDQLVALTEIQVHDDPTYIYVKTSEFKMYRDFIVESDRVLSRTNLFS